ncbi:esterase/lipase family protein, partial [Aspergillus undulatus]|uniref:esterase/lipase family protein n=1 Tax=Aspergillus undulatus TaxID=1810928 RepID=UPI003CCE264A
MSGDSPATEGLFQVYPPQQNREDFDLDVVFVHGLGEDSVSTWTENTTYWPRDLLPTSKLYENARMLTFGYNTEGFLSANGGYHNVRTFTCAEALVTDLADNRKADPYRPLIFVGHSLGGIIIKSAIKYAFVQPDIYGSIVESTKAIVFFSTPHQGADAGAWNAIFASFQQADIHDTLVVQELTLWSSMLL